jgi:hypothetical protein
MRLAIFLTCALLVELHASVVCAQLPGDAQIYFADQPSSCRDAYEYRAAFEPFDIYAVAFDVPDGMEGYEFSIALPPQLVVSGGRLLPEGATDTGAGDDNWIVATGGVCQGQVGSFWLVHYADALFLAPPDFNTTVCMAGATPSSVPSGLPGYRTCGPSGEVRAFHAAYTHCAVINLLPPFPSPCGSDATQEVSFGTLKSGFGP